MSHQVPSEVLAAAASPAATVTAADVQKAGYTGFGSFHSDDVEVLIRQDAATYKPPALPFVDPGEQWLARLAQSAPASNSAAESSGSGCTIENAAAATENVSNNSSSSIWGVSARDQFQVDFQNWTFINHGAFGGASRCVVCVGCWQWISSRDPMQTDTWPKVAISSTMRMPARSSTCTCA